MSKTLTVPEVLALVEEIFYKDWCLNVQVPDVGYLIWWGWDANDVNTGERIRCNSRKWLVEFHPTTEQFIKTAFMAALQAEEHECRENFQVLNTETGKLTRPFDPHKEIL